MCQTVCVIVSASDRERLEAIAADRNRPRKRIERVRVVLASADHRPVQHVAGEVGVSTETVRKWRKRGPGDCLDHSARPHRLPWKATEEERAVVCALRRATGFALDDLTFVVALKTRIMLPLPSACPDQAIMRLALGRLPRLIS